MRVDPLQRLHTLDNLAELLKQPPPGMPRTLRDGSLQVPSCKIRVSHGVSSDCSRLRQHLSSRFSQRLEL